MKILSIETSCDETAVAILEATGTTENASFSILGNALYSQAHKHASFGGVYPTLAKREHAQNLPSLLETALQQTPLFSVLDTKIILTEKQHEFLKTLLIREEGLYQNLVQVVTKIEKPTIDAIAVTYGPGLEPALWVGINFARALAYVWDLPILPVNHLEGHIIASIVHSNDSENHLYEATKVTFPLLGLILSGGHTEFVYTKTWGSYRVLGATLDDSIGEAFDKVARLLGIPYPGGEGLSKLAEQGRKTLASRPAHYMKDIKKLPRPMLQSNSLDFSFSGLKTAVLYQVKELQSLSEVQKSLLASEFEDAAGDVIVQKTKLALSQNSTHTFVLGGGVSANTFIRKRLEKMFNELQNGCELKLPAKDLSTDNAIMIGMAGYFMHLRKTLEKRSTDELIAKGNLGLDQ